MPTLATVFVRSFRQQRICMLDNSIPAAALQAKASGRSSSSSSSAAERTAAKERQLQERYGASSSAAGELELLLQCAQQCLEGEQQQHCEDSSDTCYECHLALAEVSLIKYSYNGILQK
jgi:hypothetical protein